MYAHNHNNTIIRTHAGTLLYKYMYLSLYCKGSKRVTQGLRVRRSWRPNRNCNISTPTLMAISVVSFLFSWCSTGEPEAHSAGWWLSYQHLLWTPTHQGPKTPSAWCGFSYHISSITRLISNCNSLGAPRPRQTDVALPTISRLSPSPTLTRTSWLLSWLSYIIVQRPLSRLLDLWNRMFDHHHQAEITVMQFTGHSLPVHQSMSVPWEFFYLVPFRQPISPMRFPLITAIRMCHFLPMHHLGMAFLAGSKVKIQQ